ncbi:Putative shell protein [Oleidesulfovibrio alaskensis G20]|jgi:ethanolamine utilization protein EutJ|uniref:Putative shell protein n=1 Tax=Oleidesulfovibrio alaskensis (strain ATCC BAA-1058 / DSM 17464 / G20) TaxID=207559 RepID=Q30W77_OLEA2|nr:ethanolamine utilization protein EutJ [Oleidesulfovibrio alaskensis]ABB40069.1 Putative shell protein [Oleidesulfovibrio alaskensis G20]MBG0773863.1 ethanolamine utilization protein EutJ [Oleidesulfovibrio alaskensis]MBL3581117.1 ethanolamine utilization protein EutJ [Oleidesulfovibrio alaskensis]
MDFAAIDKQISALEACIDSTVEVTPGEQLSVGVDLGTAYIVVVVLNAAGSPVACAMEFAQVIKDGLVVDYVGATRIVRRLVQQLEERLGRQLTHAAIAVPPGTGHKDSNTHRHVVEGAGLEVTAILDEPTAANAVLGVQNGVIVDIGGGTTGLSVIEDGKVTYVADEPTGGTHVSLVLAGSYRISFTEAEELKKDQDRQREILPVVRPVIQKMASIVNRHIEGRDISAIYLVGGTCCLKDFETVFEKETGRPVYKPANPFLVTPLGIALNCNA